MGVIGDAAHWASLVQVSTQLLFKHTMPAPQWLSIKHSSHVSLGKPAPFMPTVSQWVLFIWFGLARQLSSDVHWTQRLFAMSQTRLLPFALQPVPLLAVPQGTRPASLNPGMPPAPVEDVPAPPPVPVVEATLPPEPVGPLPFVPPLPVVLDVLPPLELLPPQAANTKQPATSVPIVHRI